MYRLGWEVAANPSQQSGQSHDPGNIKYMLNGVGCKAIMGDTGQQTTGQQTIVAGLRHTPGVLNDR